MGSAEVRTYIAKLADRDGKPDVAAAAGLRQQAAEGVSHRAARTRPRGIQTQATGVHVRAELNVQAWA
jgi:hypothetical protein